MNMPFWEKEKMFSAGNKCWIYPASPQASDLAFPVIYDRNARSQICDVHSLSLLFETMLILQKPSLYLYIHTQTQTIRMIQICIMPQI